MGELKSKMVNHVRSAQRWLNRAEQAFESDKDMRGKLDLMLAQAEMQHLHESANQGKSLSLIKQAVAFSVAAVVFSSGIGGAYFYFHYSDLPQKNAIQRADHQLSLPLSPPQALLEPNFASSTPASGGVADAAAVPSTMQPTLAVVQRESPRVSNDPVAADREVSVSKIVRPEEMQKLIRVAAKSLRGQ